MRLFVANVLKSMFITAFLMLLGSAAFPETITPNEEGSEYNPVLSSVESGYEDTYNGSVQIYLVEPASTRWGRPYHMGFLDFVFEYGHELPISLSAGEISEMSIPLNPVIGSYDPSVTPDNILAIAVVFSNNLQQAIGCSTLDNAYFVDACAAADPTYSWPHQRSDGFTHYIFMEEATWRE